MAFVCWQLAGILRWFLPARINLSDHDTGLAQPRYVTLRSAPVCDNPMNR